MTDDRDNARMYELNDKTTVTIDGVEHEATVVGRTFEDAPRYDLRLANGDVLVNIIYIPNPLDVRL